MFVGSVFLFCFVCGGGGFGLIWVFFLLGFLVHLFWGFLLLPFLMSCSFPNCKANFYFLEGALDALLCGNSSDAG